MLAYRFRHRRLETVSASDYEAAVCEFHRGLAAHAPGGFVASSALRLDGAGATGSADYEDWYLLDSFAALGRLGEAATSAALAGVHDCAAALNAAGSAGLYAAGEGAVAPTGDLVWFDKAPGTSYAAFHEALEPICSRSGATLWQRQLSLGPGAEFCLVGAPVDLGGPDTAFVAAERLFGASLFGAAGPGGRDGPE